jgi:hypothetical protein
MNINIFLNKRLMCNEEKWKSHPMETDFPSLFRFDGNVEKPPRQCLAFQHSHKAFFKKAEY